MALAERVTAHFEVGPDAARAISRAVRTAGDVTADGLWNACRTHMRAPLDDLARRIDAVADWEDLVLPASEIEILRIDPKLEREQVERVKAVRAKRDQARCTKALSELRKAARGKDNLMPYILEAVRAYSTEGEIMGTLIDVFGLYTEQAVI